MTERMKPPARRTGRALGGAAKKTTPPPTAELTPEQFAAEQAFADGGGSPAASAPQVQPAPSAAPIEGAAQASAQLTVEVAPSGPVQEPAVSQAARPAIGAPEAEMESAAEPVERQAPTMAPAVGLPAASAVQPAQLAEPVAQHGPSHVTSATSGPATAAEVAIRPAAPPAAGGTAFPIRTDVQGAHQKQDVRSQMAPSEGTSLALGPGRPKDIPETAAVLNQRIITRESLDSSVPAALKLKKRIKRFALDNELDHLPIGDIVSVALDEWLTTRGF
jgi:hypothetical protein